jgi:hypothetical protein
MTTRTNNAEAAALEAAALELQVATTRLTEIPGLLRGLILNSVLRSELVTFDATGVVERNTSTPYASLGVWNYGEEVIASSSPPQPDAAPTGGIGVIIVPSLAAVVWPLTGTTITLYGTPGDQALLALWATPQCPMVVTGVANVDGGGA